MPTIRIDEIAKTDDGATHNYNYNAIMTSITQFSSTINKIRDILRLHTPSIVNEQSSNHICLYILARRLTIKKCTEVKIPLDFAWENIVKQYRSVDGGVQRAYDLFYSPTDECFIRYLDEIFGTSTEDYPFKVKELEKHKQIIELMDKIDMDNIDIGIDPIGFVYEDELSHSKGARKNGEHFTDRGICEYMTKLVNPRLNSDGIPESICDPSMGTGGFLYTYQKFFKDANIDVNWNIHKHRIYGQDVINSSVCKAKMNLYMNTSVVCENLILRNSLTNDLQNTAFDIILANMPFGLKGLIYKDCCKRVKDLKINGTKSEPLFLQLMMVSLNMGGRCAVVVPDGMLVNDSSCHKGTREYLLDNFDLKRVIKMKGQFFMNTSIQPSILFFENTGKPTEAVEFWEVVKGDKGEITETMVVSVPRTRIASDATLSLDMRRYLESDKLVTNPAGYPMVKLGDILKGVKGTLITLEKATAGRFPLYSASVDIKTHVEAGFSGEESIIQACVGSNLVNCIHYVNTPFAATGNLWVLRKKDCEYDVSLKFVYYWLRLTMMVLKKINVSVLPKVNKAEFDSIEMPLPPLPVQQEIVATLDRIYNPGTAELAQTLKLTDKAMELVLVNPAGASLETIVEAQRLMRKSAQMVADVKAQMVVDVKSQMAAVVKASMAGSGCTKYILSDLANDNPENLTKADKFETINYVDLGSVKEGIISTIQTIPFKEKPSRAQRKIQNGDIVWGGVRPLSRSYAFIDTAVDNMIGSSGFVVIRNKDTTKVLSKYLYYVLTTDDCVNYLNSHSTGSSYPAFNASTIMAYEIVIPSTTIQRKTLERLTTLQSQLTALESLQKQSDDNARFILESYLSAN